MDNFTEPIFIDSITISEGYSPVDLVRAFCCRFSLNRHGDIEHPWIQKGSKKMLKGYQYKGDDNISVYWTHADLGRIFLSFILYFFNYL